MPLPTTDLLLAGAFVAVVVIALVVDLGLDHPVEGRTATRLALLWTTVWVGLALAFGVALVIVRGTSTGVEYATAYLVEYSLSLDNVFVFGLVFTAFAVPAAYRSRLLLWGVLGALAMRFVMILAGVAIIDRFGWVLLVLGGLLVVTAVRMALARSDAHADPSRTLAVRLVRRFVPVAGYDGGRFLVRQGGRLAVTPLLLALVVIESGDLVFALDSIPAVFGVTTDPLVVYSSNVFAVLGLRSLAILVSEATARLRFLKLGLAAVLAFVGVKLLLAEVVHVPPFVMLAVIVLVLGLAFGASLLSRGEVRRRDAAPPATT